MDYIKYMIASFFRNLFNPFDKYKTSEEGSVQESSQKTTQTTENNIIKDPSPEELDEMYEEACTELEKIYEEPVHSVFSDTLTEISGDSIEEPGYYEIVDPYEYTDEDNLQEILEN